MPTNENSKRLKCGATGEDIGGGLGLFISAQDNDYGVDEINPDGEPQLDLPAPHPEVVSACKAVVRHLLYSKKHGDHRGGGVW